MILHRGITTAVISGYVKGLVCLNIKSTRPTSYIVILKFKAKFSTSRVNKGVLIVYGAKYNKCSFVAREVRLLLNSFQLPIIWEIQIFSWKDSHIWLLGEFRF